MTELLLNISVLYCMKIKWMLWTLTYSVIYCQFCRRSSEWITTKNIPVKQHFKQKYLSAQSYEWPSSILLCLSSWGLSCPWSLAHISWGVPCKPPVTENKLPCNWSYLGKHKSIVFIIAMAPASQRFFHEGFCFFASFLHSNCLCFFAA